jgi:hypothetical protein
MGTRVIYLAPYFNERYDCVYFFKAWSIRLIYLRGGIILSFQIHPTINNADSPVNFDESK